MAAKTTFETDDWINILSHYEIGEYRNSRAFAQGAVQTNLFLQTTEGEFAFRYYENRSADSAAFEIELLQYLRTHNYPCPTPVMNREGEAIGDWKGKPYAIFLYMKGHHVENPNEMQMAELIRHIAELHLITLTYEPRLSRGRSHYNVAFCREQAAIEARRINTDNARRKLQWINRELDQLVLPHSLPMGICHCDFHFSNLLFDQNRLTAVLDFDDANYTVLLYDLVNIIDYQSWPHDGDFNFRKAQKIVRQYLKYRDLAFEEKRHLFDVYKLQVLLDSVWFMHRGDAQDFYEKQKIEALNRLGRDRFCDILFG